MRIQEHIDKISWSIADKMLFFLYGVVSIFQMRALPIDEWGLFGLMIALLTWIFIVIDSFALQNIIQFGMNENNRKKVNTYALIIQIVLAIIIASIIFLFRFDLATFFDENRLIIIGKFLPILIFLFIPRSYVIKLIYRKQDFKKLFIVDVSFFGTMTLMTFYFIFANRYLTFIDMITIYFFGSGISSLISIFLLKKDLQFSLKGNIELITLFKFSVPWTIYSALNYLPRVIDLLFVQYFFKTEATGVYYSAKNLFRVFDEALNASFGLVYPAAVRQIEKGNITALNDLMTKSVSFLFISYVVIVVSLESGLSNFLITNVLPYSYHNAVGQFNLLLVGALVMPILMLSPIITALGKPQVVLLFSAIGLIFTVVILYLVGIVGQFSYVPLGLVTYFYVSAILSFWYMNKKYNFTIKTLFRAIRDSKEFVKSFLNKNN